MQVTLLTHTDEVIRAVYTAARTCYSSDLSSEIWEQDIELDAMRTLLKKVLSSGHYSILEHISFSFAVEGLSRSATHQLVRHRIASYSQQSQRYVKFTEGFSFVIPPSIKRNPEVLEKYQQVMNQINEAYQFCLDQGIAGEDARYLLPNGCDTNIVVTMNARALHNFFELRCCTRAQWEIRNVAWAMLNLVKDAYPVIFENAGPACEVKGYCPEGAFSCGKAPIK